MRRLSGLVLLALLAGCGQTPAPAGEQAEGTPSAGATAARPAPATPAGPAPRAGSGVKVVAVGDIACEPGRRASLDTCRQRATARLTERIGPKRVIVLGDNQYDDGALASYRRSYDASWGRFKGRTLPVPGNHEYLTSNAQGYLDYFGITGPAYRAANVGTWRVYLLDSNCDRIDCAAEKAWLRRDLAAHPVACSAIAMHHPRYSSGKEHGSTVAMAGLWTVAFNHGVDLALAGHEHNYERFAPMDGRGHQVSEGITSFVVGTGGKSKYAKGARVPGSRYFRNDRFGVLALNLGDGEFAWRFKMIGGGVRDAGSASCH